jgi:hypothetical protein
VSELAELIEAARFQSWCVRLGRGVEGTCRELRPARLWCQGCLLAALLDRFGPEGGGGKDGGETQHGEGPQDSHTDTDATEGGDGGDDPTRCPACRRRWSEHSEEEFDRCAAELGRQWIKGALAPIFTDDPT